MFGLRSKQSILDQYTTTTNSEDSDEVKLRGNNLVVLKLPVKPHHTKGNGYVCSQWLAFWWYICAHIR